MMLTIALALCLTPLAQVPLQTSSPRAGTSSQTYGDSSQPYFNGALLPSGMVLERTPSGGGQFQATLRIEETSGDIARDQLQAIELDFGKPTLAENCLLTKLRSSDQGERLDRVELVETLSARPAGNSIVLRRIRAIEGTGSVESVNTATNYIERFLKANEAVIEVNISIYSTKITSEATPEVRVAPLDAAGVEAKRAEFENSAVPFELLMAPKLTLYGGQPGGIRLQSEERYIKNFESIEISGKKITVPVVESLPSGIELSIQSWIDPDGDGVNSELSFDLRELGRPMRQFTTKLEYGEPVTIDLPEWSTTSWSSADILTTKESPGFVITGLRSRVKNASAPNGELRDVTILGSIRKLSGLDEIATPAPKDSIVLGFDASTKKVFIQQGLTRVSAKSIVLLRGNDVVGRGKLLSAAGDVLIVELTSGETKAGDIAQEVKPW